MNSGAVHRWNFSPVRRSHHKIISTHPVLLGGLLIFKIVLSTIVLQYIVILSSNNNNSKDANICNVVVYQHEKKNITFLSILVFYDMLLIWPFINYI